MVTHCTEGCKACKPLTQKEEAQSALHHARHILALDHACLSTKLWCCSSHTFHYRYTALLVVSNTCHWISLHTHIALPACFYSLQGCVWPSNSFLLHYPTHEFLLCSPSEQFYNKNHSLLSVRYLCE